MLEFAGDVFIVVVGLWVYDKIKDWKRNRRYHDF